MLLRANGQALAGPLDWESVLLDLRAGDPLSLSLQGRGEPIALEAVAFPTVTAERVTLFQDIELISVTPQVQLERDLASSYGAMITDISDELSARLGLQRDDVILQMNRTSIRSADDAARYFRSLEGNGRVILYIERNGSYGTRTLYLRG